MTPLLEPLLKPLPEPLPEPLLKPLPEPEPLQPLQPRTTRPSFLLGIRQTW